MIVWKNLAGIVPWLVCASRKVVWNLNRHRERRRQVNQSRSPGFLNDAPPSASSLHLRVGRSPLKFSGAQLMYIDG